MNKKHKDGSNCNDIEYIIFEFEEQCTCVHCQLFKQINELKFEIGRIMSKISDFADIVDANFKKISDGVVALDKQIQDLQNSSGTLTPEDQARLDEIVTASSALATAASAPVTPPVDTTIGGTGQDTVTA